MKVEALWHAGTITVFIGEGNPIWEADADEDSQVTRTVEQTVDEDLANTTNLSALMIQALLTERTGRVGRTP